MGKSGGGLISWLGRQVGYVRAAIRTQVTAKTIYRRQDVKQGPVPGSPNVTARRTVTDELIVEEKRVSKGP